jgi:aryl-alcohol dehydrogenase-like predicted oxidoreductase
MSGVMHDADLGPLRVSRLALGTMLMGGRTPVDESHRILDAFVDAGGTLIDTADVYGDGTSEQVLAPWLARRRGTVAVATKTRFEVSDPPGAGLAPERISRACDASLRRLGIDVIDLYQLHAPDPDVPLDDTLQALDELVRVGKVRAIGASNFPAWLLAWAVAVQEREGWARFVSLQPQYSLVERSIEVEILPFCRWAGIGVLPWGPLAAGFLTGRYERGGETPPGTRLGDADDVLEEAPARRAVERNFRAVDAARAVAEELGATVAQVALAWLLHQPGVTAPIIGPRTREQLEDLLPAVDLRLTDEQLARLSATTAPPARYPDRFLAEQSGIDVERQAVPDRPEVAR